MLDFDLDNLEVNVDDPVDDALFGRSRTEFTDFSLLELLILLLELWLLMSLLLLLLDTDSGCNAAELLGKGTELLPTALRLSAVIDPLKSSAID